MKGKLRLINFLIIVLFVLVGCSKTSVSDAEKVAKKFITTLYNLESNKSQEILKSEENINSSYNEFKKIMTDTELDALIKKWNVYEDGSIL